MAAKRKSKKARLTDTLRAAEPRTFAYVELEDEFEIPPIPVRYALEEARVAFQVKPAWGVDASH